jgi:hypothetical protein
MEWIQPLQDPGPDIEVISAWGIHSPKDLEGKQARKGLSGDLFWPDFQGKKPNKSCF